MNLGASLRIARIRGIDIRIHWSWLIIFWLITWGVAGIFAEIHEDWSEGPRWAAALLASTLFFASILAHELSHAFVAQSYGLRVPSITLFIFGGVASLADDAETARQEFRVALAGPLMSFLLGGVFGLVWLVIRSETISAVPGYLALINVALAVFNLLPGFPLDGGRVFRAIVWALTGSRIRATRVAARVGTVIAYLLIAFGIGFLAFGELGGLWYVILGLFLRSAASGSEQAVLIEQTLAAVTVREVMRPPPDPIPAAMTLQEFVDTRILVSGERCYMVGDDGAVIGLITTSDLTRVPRNRWTAVTVQEAMVPEERIVVIAPAVPVLEGLRLMQEHDIHQLPVIEDGRLGGLLTRGDVMRQIELRRRFVELDEKEEEREEVAPPR